MDFNDEDFNTTNYKKRENKHNSNVFVSILSGIFGGLIVLLVLVILSRGNIIGIFESESATTGSEDYTQEATTVGTTEVIVGVNSAITEAVEKVKSAVVGVVNIQEYSNFWSRDTEIVDAGEGSGVVFNKKDGKAYIITNFHVIEGAKEVEVALSTGERVSAELEGYDSLTDLAVLTIDDKYVDAVAELGDSSNLKQGEPAIAIGNPLGQEFSQTVTVGVISSENRNIGNDLDGDGVSDWETNVIQTDAAINPGNSGGALVNIEGYVIGINSAKISDTDVEGLGFAIPTNEAIPIIDDIINYGKVIRPYLGISPFDIQSATQSEREETLNLPDSIQEGVVIVEIPSLGPADVAGLEKLDVIVKLDNEEIANSSELRKYIYTEKEVGDEMKVTFYRDGVLNTITLILKEFPSN